LAHHGFVNDVAKANDRMAEVRETGPMSRSVPGRAPKRSGTFFVLSRR